MEGDLEREQNIFLPYRYFLPQLLAPLLLVDVVVVGADDHSPLQAKAKLLNSVVAVAAASVADSQGSSFPFQK